MYVCVVYCVCVFVCACACMRVCVCDNMCIVIIQVGTSCTSLYGLLRLQ